VTLVSVFVLLIVFVVSMHFAVSLLATVFK